MAISLKPPRQVPGAPAYTALLAKLHEVVSGCAYQTLDELSAQVRGRPGKRRLSELVRGAGAFPPRPEIAAPGGAGGPGRGGPVPGSFCTAPAGRAALAGTPPGRGRG